MDFRRSRKIAALKARLEIYETERDKLLKSLTSSGVRLAHISDDVERLQKELRRLKKDLNVLEMEDRQQ